MNEIQKMLDSLAELRTAKEESLGMKQILIDSVLTPEIKARIADIDAEWADKDSEVDNKIKFMEGVIEEAVLEYGASVKGESLQAVYNRGRVTWDTRGLDAAMRLIPALADYRKEGNPYIAIRKA